MNPNWQFRLKRIRNVISVLFKSKTAVAGIIILALFTGLAIGAPLATCLTQCGADPNFTTVSGSLAEPSWYSFFNEGSRLSQNYMLEPNGGFSSDPLGTNGWKFTSSGNFLSASYYPDISYSTGTGGSIGVTLDKLTATPGNYTARVEKTFNWPYDGQPYSFQGEAHIFAANASQSQPVRATVYIRSLSTGTEYDLTDPNEGPSNSSNLSWGQFPFVKPLWLRPSLGSSDTAVTIVLHISTINAARLLFPARGDYAYGVRLTMTNAQQSAGQLKVFLSGMNLRLLGTSWGIMGTDFIGRDVWTQLVFGARISLLVGLLSAGVGIVVGLVVGLAAGYMGKFVDEVLMRFTDMLLVLPTLPLIIILVAVTGGRSTLAILILIIGLLGWMGFARVIRAQVLTLKERPFVEAAKAAGAGTGHITSKHIIPNIVGLIYVNLALAVPGAILSEAALSFLGLGDESIMSWGRMLNLVETNTAVRAWWWVLPPGLSIALVSVSFILIGFALDSVFNPRLRQRR